MKQLGGPLVLGVSATRLGDCPFVFLICPQMRLVGAFTLLGELSMGSDQFTTHLETLLLLLRHALAFGFSASPFGIGAFGFTFSAQAFAFGALMLLFGALALLLESLLNGREFVGELRYARLCSGRTVSLGFGLLESTIGAIAFGVGTLALLLRVLPGRNCPFAFGFCDAMRFFGLAMFAFRAQAFGLGALHFGLSLATGVFGPLTLFIGPLTLFADTRLRFREAFLEIFDFSRTLLPGALPLHRLSMLFFGALVFTGRAQLLPIGALALVFDALPRFCHPRGVLIAAGALAFGAFEFTPGTRLIGVCLSTHLLRTLTLLVGTQPFGIGALTLRLGAGMVLVCPLAFGEELLFQRCQSLGTEQQGFVLCIEPAQPTPFGPPQFHRIDAQPEPERCNVYPAIRAQFALQVAVRLGRQFERIDLPRGWIEDDVVGDLEHCRIDLTLGDAVCGLGVRGNDFDDDVRRFAFLGDNPGATLATLRSHGNNYVWIANVAAPAVARVRQNSQLAGNVKVIAMRPSLLESSNQRQHLLPVLIGFCNGFAIHGVSLHTGHGRGQAGVGCVAWPGVSQFAANPRGSSDMEWISRRIRAIR